LITPNKRCLEQLVTDARAGVSSIMRYLPARWAGAESYRLAILTGQSPQCPFLTDEVDLVDAWREGLASQKYLACFGRSGRMPPLRGSHAFYSAPVD